MSQLTIPQNHSVTQSSFGNPCHPLASGGFFSGFVPTMESPSSTTFTITVNDTNPIWFYCGQTLGNHCQSGMVGAINAPTNGNTLDAFILLAKHATESTSPPFGPVGGVLSNNSNSTSASSSSIVGSAASTVYSVSSYSSACDIYSMTVETSTVVTTTTSIAAASTFSSGSTSTFSIGSTSTLNIGSTSTSSSGSTSNPSSGINSTSGSAAPTQITQSGGASILSAQLFGVAAVGLGTLALL
jgi:hypothetical protein